MQQVGGVWAGRIVSGKCPGCETIPSAHTGAQLASLSRRHLSLVGRDLHVAVQGVGVESKPWHDESWKDSYSVSFITPNKMRAAALNQFLQRGSV
jgi:hypothetical protein